MSDQRVPICQADELSEGQMRQFSVLGKEILLARVGDSFSAIAAHCSHYGAPLVQGVLHEGRVVCPWHNACFEVSSGVQLEPPGQDDLAQYVIEVEAGTVYVTLPMPEAQKATPSLAEADLQSDRRTFVIIGGGAAGSAAAQMLRQVGFQGHIVMLTAESELPYDRTTLSKAYLQSDRIEDPKHLRSADFYEQHRIEVITSAEVKKLDVEAQQVAYGAPAGDKTLSYDALLLATGGKAKQIPIDGADKANVFTLRNIQDAQKILQAAQDAQRAVIIGTGFIGMEVAASLKAQGLAVTVVAPDAVPFEKVLGKSVGQLFQQVHESQGVEFRLESKVTAIQGDATAEAVELAGGEKLPADLVVVGIGVKPATDFIEGIALSEKDGGVVVDQYLRAASNVYAAGDIAQFPHFITQVPVRIEHWRLAMQHGRIAACNMASQQIPFKSVPFFWTGQFDLKLRYVGHAEDYDDVIIQGGLEKKSFLAFYVKGQQVLAVAGIGRDRAIAAISELMRQEKMPTADKIRSANLDWVEQLAK